MKQNIYNINIIYTEYDANTVVSCHFLFTFGNIVGTSECIESVGVCKPG